MKKRYVILAALLVTALAAAGCGKKQTEDTGKDGQVTVAPAENTDTASSDDSSLVDMQKSDDADIKNVIAFRHSLFHAVHSSFRYCFIPHAMLLYQSITRFLSFGGAFQPRTFSAQDLSTSELLRTL